MSRAEAAAYIGVSVVTFENLVRRGLMPNPKQVMSRLVWDRQQVDHAFAELPEHDMVTPVKAAAGAWD